MSGAPLPWLRFYGSVPATLDYPRTTLYERVAETARRLPEAVAWDFFGTTSTYRQLSPTSTAARARSPRSGWAAGTAS